MSELPPPDAPRYSVSAFDPTAGETPADAYVVGMMCHECGICYKEGIECADRRIVLRPITTTEAKRLKGKTDAWDECEGTCYAAI